MRLRTRPPLLTYLLHRNGRNSVCSATGTMSNSWALRTIGYPVIRALDSEESPSGEECECGGRKRSVNGCGQVRFVAERTAK